MKLMHIHGVYGDVPTYRRAISHAAKEGVDVIACTGDMIGQCLDREQVERMQKAFSIVRRGVNIDGGFVQKLAHIRNDSDAPQQFKDAADFYTALEGVFDGNARKQYEQLEIWSEGSPARIFVIPGGNDSIAFPRYFSQFDVHGWKRKVGLGDAEIFEREMAGENGSFQREVTFAGFGAQPNMSGIVPPTKSIGFSGDKLVDFLSGAGPDVALTYVPPRGLNDVVVRDGAEVHMGNESVLNYIRRENPAVLFTGGNGKPGVMRDVEVNRDNPDASSTHVISSGILGRMEGYPYAEMFSVTELDAYNVLADGPRFYQFRDGTVEELGEVEEVVENLVA